MFSCEFCEISKGICFHRTPPVAASVVSNNLQSNPLEVFYVKPILKYFSQENICARLSFLMKLLAEDLQLYNKRGSGTDVILWILRNISK